jgi:hypothetical protein
MTRRFAMPGASAMHAAGALAVCACLFCTPPPRQVVLVEPGIPWTTAALGYAAYDSSKVIAEIGRLQRQLDSASDTSKTASGTPGDSALSKREILTRLFELVVHVNNPHPDYHRACALASLLRQAYPDSGSYYANWEGAIERLAEATDRVDSLLRAMNDASRDGQSQRTNALKSKHAIDSLTAVIKDQNKTIGTQQATLDGLKKLELRMEAQRRKVQ